MTAVALSWPGKGPIPPEAPAGVLTEEPALSEGAGGDNQLIEGDNLAVLALLAKRQPGSARCVYIDPPYNTRSAISAHYEDSAAHGAWLDGLRRRLHLLRTLLAADGLLFVQIDDREMAYLQVLCDEVFGREQRINQIVVKMSELSGLKMSHVDHRLPKVKEYILVYGRSPAARLQSLRVMKPEDKLSRYRSYYAKVIENPDDPVEAWRIVPIVEHLRALGRSTRPEAVAAFQMEERHRVVYRTNNPFLRGLSFPGPLARVTSPKGVAYIWWEGKQMLFLADHVEEHIGDLWTDISTINLNKEGGCPFPNGKKPERLIARILALSTRPGDLVLDAYAGSGTTAAVAHKMGRRWIAIEQGPQARSHCAPRLRRVVRGEDGAGISAELGWKGGGAFTFSRWSPP